MEEYESRLLEAEIQIRELEKEIKELRARPTTTTNVTINNTVNQYIKNNFKPITQQVLDDHVASLTLTHILEGATGFAKYALDYPLKDTRMICIDFARRICRYMKEPDLITTDPELAEFVPMFFQTIRNASTTQIMEHINSLKLDLTDSDQMNDWQKYAGLITNINSSARGENTSFNSAFVRRICSGTHKDRLLFAD